jgi:small subunit ribosomal protein S16
MSKGAKASDTVHNLLISKKIIEGKKINTLPKKKPIVKEGGEAPAVAAAPAPVAEATASAPEATPAEVVAELTPAPETVKEEAPAETPQA